MNAPSSTSAASLHGRRLRAFAVVQFSQVFAWEIWRVVFNNYLVERFDVSGFQRGALESARETAGLGLIGLTALLGRFSLPFQAALAAFVFAAGLAAFTIVPSYVWLFPAILLMSAGQHLFLVLRQVLILASAPPGEKGRLLGWLGAVAALGTLAASGAVLLGFRRVGFEGSFAVSAVIALAGGLVMLTLVHDRRGAADAPRWVVRRRYWLYYLLTLIGGARRQIFVTFAIFALVKLHGASVSTVALLSMGNNLLGIATSPRIGRIIDRFGERITLGASYFLAAAIFWGYAYADWLPMLYALYCLDSICFRAEMARSTYLDKIAPREEVAPSLAFGMTVNHILAVSMPLVGGHLWDRVGPEATFVGGAILVACSLVALGWLRTPRSGTSPAP